MTLICMAFKMNFKGGNNGPLHGNCLSLDNLRHLNEIQYVHRIWFCQQDVTENIRVQ